MDELITTILKTHTGEWLTVTEITAIVNAIKGTDVEPRQISHALKALAQQGKLTKLKSKAAVTFTVTEKSLGYYI